MQPSITIAAVLSSVAFLLYGASLFGSSAMVVLLLGLNLFIVLAAA